MSSQRARATGLETRSEMESRSETQTETDLNSGLAMDLGRDSGMDSGMDSEKDSGTGSAGKHRCTESVQIQRRSNIQGSIDNFGFHQVHTGGRLGHIE